MLLYTDGSCLGNPGPGGWAYIVVHEDGVSCFSGMSGGNTTNNVMELTAIINALKHINGQEALIYSDSKYCINGIENWLPKWVENNWLSSNKKPIKNCELWQEIHALIQNNQNVTLKHVIAHNGEKYNTIVDELARKAAESCKRELVKE